MQEPSSASSGGVLKRDRLLLISNAVLLLVLILHDLDHYRQTVNFCFSLSARFWTVLMLGFVPVVTSLWLSYRRRRAAAVVTAVSGLTIGTILIAGHLIGGVPFAERYTLTYWELGVDRLSWAMLWALAGACVLCTGVGLYSCSGRTTKSS